MSVDEALSSKKNREVLGWCKNCPFTLCTFNEVSDEEFGGHDAGCRSQSWRHRKENRG